MRPARPIGLARVGITVVVGLVLLAACATGKDAVISGQDFTFVSPGGQTRIFYDPPERRGGAPELSGERLLPAGQQIRLSDFVGKVAVINIWGSWCGPCRTETPQLEQVFEQTRNSGVAFLGIDVRDEVRSAAEDFVRDRNVSYPSIYDPPGRSLLALSGYPRNVVPSTLVLDRQHRVAAVFLTTLLAIDLLPVVQRIAAEQPSATMPGS